MRKSRQSLARSRLSCRGSAREIVALVGVAALLVGCTTTHTLGRIDDPGVREEVDAIARNGDALVRVRQAAGTRPPPFGERVTGLSSTGLVIEPVRGQPLLVAREQVSSLSRYNHARGALDGAIGSGIAGFAVGFTLGVLVTSAHPGCSDNCAEGPDPITVGSRAGAIFGVIALLAGAAIGAAGGHEDRFEISP